MTDNPFDWQQFLVFAKSVPLDTATEAALRSAVSRAYYAAYWKARRRLEKRAGTTITSKNAHESVWEEYAFVKNAVGTPLRELGDKLRRKRAWADYQSLPPIRRTDAEAAILEAEEIIRCIQTLAS